MAMVQYTDHDHSANAKCQIGLISVSVGSGKRKNTSSYWVSAKMLYPDNPTIQWLTVLDKPIYSNIFDGQGNPRPAVENEMFEK
jgi:hypothetical protein